MTKLFKRFHFPRKQQARQSFGSVSSSSTNSSSIQMDSTRPSIYLHNQSTRSGVKKYTCSPKLTLYLQELQEGPQMKYQENRRNPLKRQSSLMLRKSGKPSDASRSSVLVMDQDAFQQDQRSSLLRTSSVLRNLGLEEDESTDSWATIGFGREDSQPSSRFDMGDYLDDDQIRMSMFQDIGKR